MFKTLLLSDPMSRARTRPDYTAELAKWRATLRPFLYPDGALVQERQLESCNPSCTLSQNAVHLTTEGIRWRREFALVFNGGDGATKRSSHPPHFITAEEEARFDSESRHAVASLRSEFASLLSQLPDKVAASDLCVSFDSAKTKDGKANELLY